MLTNTPRFGIVGFGPEVELAYLWGYLVFAMVVYFRWALLVISAICDYLEINCLTIPSGKSKAKKAAVTNGKAE